MTVTVDLDDADLSTLIERVRLGEEIVITEAGEPVARLVAERSSHVGLAAPKANSSCTTTSTILCPTISSICSKARATSPFAAEQDGSAGSEIEPDRRRADRARHGGRRLADRRRLPERPRGGALRHGQGAGGDGLAETFVVADLAIWPLRYTATGDDLNQVQATIDADGAEITAFLTREGIAAEAIAPQRVEVTDLLAQAYRPEAPRTTASSSPRQSWCAPSRSTWWRRSTARPASW